MMMHTIKISKDGKVFRESVAVAVFDRESKYILKR